MRAACYKHNLCYAHGLILKCVFTLLRDRLVLHIFSLSVANIANCFAAFARLVDMILTQRHRRRRRLSAPFSLLC